MLKIWIQVGSHLPAQGVKSLKQTVSRLGHKYFTRCLVLLRPVDVEFRNGPQFQFPLVALQRRLGEFQRVFIHSQVFAGIDHRPVGALRRGDQAQQLVFQVVLALLQAGLGHHDRNQIDFAAPVS